MTDYDRIVQTIEDLEAEHFKQPCDPTRCSHQSTIRPAAPSEAAGRG